MHVRVVLECLGQLWQETRYLWKWRSGWEVVMVVLSLQGDLGANLGRGSSHFSLPIAGFVSHILPSVSDAVGNLDFTTWLFSYIRCLVLGGGKLQFCILLNTLRRPYIAHGGCFVCRRALQENSMEFPRLGHLENRTVVVNGLYPTTSVLMFRHWCPPLIPF